jgi:hypothetical protein
MGDQDGPGRSFPDGRTDQKQAAAGQLDGTGFEVPGASQFYEHLEAVGVRGDEFGEAVRQAGRRRA